MLCYNLEFQINVDNCYFDELYLKRNWFDYLPYYLNFLDPSNPHDVELEVLRRMLSDQINKKMGT